MVETRLRTAHCAAHGGRLGSRAVGFAEAASLLDETRILLEQAREVVCGSLEADEAAAEASAQSVLSLYEELRARLGAIDDDRVRALLASIARNVEQLERLAARSDRLRGLRRALVADL